jgi:surface-anchored protein
MRQATFETRAPWRTRPFWLNTLLGASSLAACGGSDGDRGKNVEDGWGGEAPLAGQAGESTSAGVAGAGVLGAGAGNAGESGAGRSAGGRATAGHGAIAGESGASAGGEAAGTPSHGGAGGEGVSCAEGYERDGEDCVDVDECANGDAACSGHALCENTPGAFSCVCPPAWQGDPAELCCPEPQPPAEPASIALSIGHVDVLAMSYECQGGGGIGIAARDDSPGLGDAVFRRVENVLIHGTIDATMLTLPEGFDFLGPEGAPIYVFPESFVETVVWPGWNSNGTPPGVFDDDELTLILNSVDGPGDFVGFVFSDVPIIIFDTETEVDRTTVRADTHTHMNWAFTSPGLYDLSFTVEAMRNGSFTSANANVRFFIGDLTTLPETEPTVIVVEGLAPAYDLGDTLSLRAISHGARVQFETRWLQQCPIDARAGNFDVTPWSPVGTGISLEYTLVAVDEGCHYRAVMIDEFGAEHATSQTVQPAVAWPEG